MTVYVLVVDRKPAGVYDEHTKVYDAGCEKYNGNFDIDEFDIE